MSEIWILLGIAALITAILLGTAGIAALNRKNRFRENTVKRDAFCRLLSAITRVHLAGDDEELLAIARLDLADIVHQMNLIGGYEVLLHLNALLEMQNRSTGFSPDLPKEHAILQKLVYAMRQEMKEGRIKQFEQNTFAFKFYLPASTRNEEGANTNTQERSRDL